MLLKSGGGRRDRKKFECLVLDGHLRIMVLKELGVSVGPEAITLLQDKQFTPDLTLILSNMRAAREVEAVVLMIASYTIAAAHAETVLNAAAPE